MKRPRLTARMRELALTHPDLATAASLVETAQGFDDATDGFYAIPQTATVEQFLGAWARARRVYCEASGEPLI